MNTAEQRRLEDLFSRIVDGAACEQDYRELDSLLLGRPDLQKHYSSLVALQLITSWELGLFAPELAASPAAAPRTRAPLASEAGGLLPAPAVVGAAAREDLYAFFKSGAKRSLFSLRDFLRRDSLNGSWIASIAAVLLVGIVGWGVASWIAGEPATTSQEEANQNQQASFDASGGGFVISDPNTLRSVEELTKSESLNSVILPARRIDPSPGFTLCSGSAWLDYAPGRQERGYLYSLRPGQRMDVLIDANAVCLNGLSVIEVDSLGAATGRRLAFNNNSSNPQSGLERQHDSMGQFSELNDGQTSRYFLFTGIHKPGLSMGVQGLAIDADPWRPSDFRVQLDEGGWLVVGWDDSSFSPEDPAIIDRDRDFNDMRVLIRTLAIGDKSHGPPEPPLYAPAPFDDGRELEPGGDEFVFDVKPGESALMMVSSEASLPNTLCIVEDATNRVLWEFLGGENQLLLPHQSGAFLIRNNRGVALRYRLAGFLQNRDQRASAADKTLMPHIVHSESFDGVTIGYEDGWVEEEAPDWNDLRVSVHITSD